MFLLFRDFWLLFISVYFYLCPQKDLVKRLHLLLTVKDSAANIPKNLEARRRLEFFTNSLFIDIPSAKPVSEMVPFRYRWVSSDELKFLLTGHTLLFLITSVGLFDNSVFTPYYSETVLYSSSELRVENEDGISVLFYLQKIFPGILVCIWLVFCTLYEFFMCQPCFHYNGVCYIGMLTQMAWIIKTSIAMDYDVFFHRNHRPTTFCSFLFFGGYISIAYCWFCEFFPLFLFSFIGNTLNPKA